MEMAGCAEFVEYRSKRCGIGAGCAMDVHYVGGGGAEVSSGGAGFVMEDGVQDGLADLSETVSERRGSGAGWAAENVQEDGLPDFHETVSERRGSGSNSEFAHGVKKDVNSSGHPHAQSSPSALSSCVSSGASGGGFPSVGFGGSPGWGRGRWSARLSSPLCCPGCGLYGDGTLCMVCDVG